MLGYGRLSKIVSVRVSVRMCGAMSVLVGWYGFHASHVHTSRTATTWNDDRTSELALQNRI